MQSDPIGQRGGVNLYLYANANPSQWIDFFGLDASCVRDDDGALEAETRRSEAGDDIANSRSWNDQAGEENARLRLDWWTRTYHCRICQGEPNTAPQPPRIPPTAPPVVTPPPHINFDE